MISAHQSLPCTRSEAKSRFACCLGPIILSPLNSPVKMSPHEQGDIRREPERVTTSGGSFFMHPRKRCASPSRRPPLLLSAAEQQPAVNTAPIRGGPLPPHPPRTAPS